MNDLVQLWPRIGLFGEIVSRSKSRLGRTAIMKLVYFLQTIRSMPLNYDFRIHTYGPFDSDVLYDLGQAETLGVVDESQVATTVGYGYEYSKGRSFDQTRAKFAGILKNYYMDIDWVLGRFGSCSASELELLSTIVFADREAKRKKSHSDISTLASNVKQIKPHFDEEYIAAQARTLQEEGLLISM